LAASTAERDRLRLLGFPIASTSASGFASFTAWAITAFGARFRKFRPYGRAPAAAVARLVTVFV